MTERNILLKDIVNVGPQTKRGKTDWKSVYGLMAGIVAEYVRNVIKPGPDDTISMELESFFWKATKDSRRLLADLAEYDSLDDVLDVVEFEEDEGRYREFSSSVCFVLDGARSRISIGDLEFPFA